MQSNKKQRVSMKGKIVEVQGGHIARSTTSRDRHSKVCTAKGLRDRRVRLSAHTALQFYDLQHRLGYDRPSKALDWLISKAKTSIDHLQKLPPWNPLLNKDSNHQEDEVEEEESLKPTFHSDPPMEPSQDLRLSLHPNHYLETPFTASGYLCGPPGMESGGTLQSSYSSSIRGWIDPSMGGYCYQGWNMQRGMSFDGGLINKGSSFDSLR